MVAAALPDRGAAQIATDHVRAVTWARGNRSQRRWPAWMHFQQRGADVKKTRRMVSTVMLVTTDIFARESSYSSKSHSQLTR